MDSYWDTVGIQNQRELKPNANASNNTVSNTNVKKPDKTVKTIDHRVDYYDEAHVYEVTNLSDGSKRIATSTSQIIKRWCGSQTSYDDIIRNKRKDWIEKKSTYAEKTDEEIKEIWSKKSEKAIADGKSIHNIIDSALRYVIENRRTEHDNDYTTTSCRMKMMAKLLEFQIKHTAIVKPYMNEWKSFFYDFLNNHDTLVVVLTEFIVYDPETNVAGTCDALFYDSLTKDYVLVDWKRSESIGPGYCSDLGEQTTNEFEQIEKPHPILCDIHLGNYTTYSLQISSYKNTIQRHGVFDEDGNVVVPKNASISKAIVVNVHPQFSGLSQNIVLKQHFYDTIYLPIYDAESRTADTATDRSKRKRQEETLDEPSTKKRRSEETAK